MLRVIRFPQGPARAACMRRAFATQAAAEEVRKTPLYEFHKAHGGKMVPFSGWSLPVQYSDMGMVDSHLHTRKAASLFDVSHMLQLRFVGRDRVKFIESLVVGNIGELKEGHGTLSLITNERGGIKDDTVINNAGDHLYVVCNAGCADKDLAHLKAHLQSFVNAGGDVGMEVLSGMALVALQGPLAAAALAKHTDLNLAKMGFMNGATATVAGVPGCRVTRCGYTGEDGFELSIPAADSVGVCEALLTDDNVRLAGLGARDSLRLEAGLCLYGHDIDEDTTPIEASLAWTIGARRRTEGGFLGSEIILEQLRTQGGNKRRVGFITTGAPARESSTITDANGNGLGVITSGIPSPSLKKNIAMGYVQKPHNKVGSEVQIVVRKRAQPGVVTKMPFVPTNYYKPAN